MNKLTYLSPPGPSIIKSLLITLLLVTGQRYSARAQTQFTGWLATFQNYKFSNRAGLYFDGQFRTTGQLRQMQALLLRPGLNLYLTPALSATVGYAYIPQQRISGSVTGYLPEHRTWQQLLFTHPILSGHGQAPAHHLPAATLAHRLRLEQRFLPKHHAEGNALVQNGHRYAGRIRYFARTVIPLTSQRPGDASGNLPHNGTNPSAKGSASSPFTKGFFAAIQNEIFFNIGDTAPVNGKLFDQNRAYLAAGYRWSRQFDTEIGYMNQYISGTGSNSTNNHILQVATYLRL
jgi:hypothetical protein